MTLLNSRAKRQLVRVLLALGTVGLVYHFTAPHIDRKTIVRVCLAAPDYRYRDCTRNPGRESSTRSQLHWSLQLQTELTIQYTYATSPSLLLSSHASSDPYLPTHLWSYIPHLPLDASVRIAARRPAAALVPETDWHPHPPIPLTDGFEWVKAVRRRAGMSEERAREVDRAAGWGDVYGMKSATEGDD